MKSRRGQRGSLMVLTSIALPVFLAPLVGLGIDGTVCYIVQTELSAAVDGAALGTGRLLSTNANATDIANEFLNANFRVGQGGFWGSYNLTSNVTVSTGTTKTVTVSASATVPLIFLRIIHQNSATVSATATATRRDARIELVIDRSGSMNTSDGAGSTVIADLVQYAQGFTQQFTEGYDELGLVVFSGSAVVGYPTSPWPASISPTGLGGPNNTFQDGSATDMVNQIAKVKAGGGTAMGEALALAYIELQKAHMRDLQANGADTRTNAIVLFTDGVPSSVPTYLNRNSNSAISSGSGCLYATDTATPTNPMYGYVVQGSGGGNPPYTSSWGLYQLASLDTNAAHTSAWYMANPSGDYVAPVPTTPEKSCNTSGWNPLSNLSKIPSFDKYGYSLGPNGNGYKISAIVNNPNLTSIYNGTAFSTTNPTSAYQWGLASWNDADNVAEAIRSDANYANRPGDTGGPMSITIYTVGYTGNGGTDYGLLQKLANVQGCSVNGFSCYKNTQPSGIYVQASDKTALANAFSVIATAILRLAR
ncbi:MAG: VWA domain-containing protein [Acidobacteria bacterium]|nr:VWA domain-containing protein [Acidobacteriota bacterium]